MKWLLCFALAFALLTPEPAAAGPVVAALQVAAAAFSGGAGLFGAIAAGFGSLGFVGKLIVGVGLSLVGQMFAKKPRTGINETGIQTEQTTTGDTTPLKFIVGRYAVEGHAVAPAYSRGNNNRILTYILEVSNIPVTGLTDRVVIDGQWREMTPGDDDASRMDFLELGLTDAGDPLGWLWFMDGTQTDAHFKLVEQYASHPDRPWSDDHILEGTAYAVCEFAYDREVYSGMPSVRFEVDGIALYDPRKDTTVGGSGSHRWDDPDTWEFTANPQVINYNILRGITLPSGDVYGGEVPADDLPLDNWFAAMNECDVLIGDRPQYQAGFEINTNRMEPFEVIEEMNRASFAQMSEFGGVFRVRVGAPSSPVMSLTDDDFNITEPSNYTPFPGMDQTYNACTGSYVEPNDVWQARSADAVINSDWEEDDGNRRLPIDLNLPAVSNKSQAQQLLTAYIKDQRRFRVHRMVLPPSFALLEPLDTISWDSDINGYTDKVFEVISVDHRPDTLAQSVTVREREAGDVDWGSEDDVDAPDPVNGLTPPADRVPSLTVTAVSVQNDAAADVLPGILIEWSGAADAQPTDLIRWQVRNATTEEIVASGTNGVDEGEVVVTGVAGNTDYEVRARYVSEAPTAWSSWYAVTTSDISNSGVSVAQVFAYKRASSQPSTPTGGSYDFSSGVLSAPSTWFNTPDVSGSNQLWVSQAQAIASEPTGVDSTLTWSDPVTFTGEAGAPGGRGPGRWHIPVASLPTTSTAAQNAWNAASSPIPTAPVENDQAWFYTGTQANPTGQSVWICDSVSSDTSHTWDEQIEVIDGNLLVTQTITASKLELRDLSNLIPNGDLLDNTGGTFPDAAVWTVSSGAGFQYRERGGGGGGAYGSSAPAEFFFRADTESFVGMESPCRFEVEPGEQFRITFDYAARDTGTILGPVMRFIENDGTRLSDDFNTIVSNDTGGWTKYSGTFTAPANAAYCDAFRIEHQSGESYVANMRLKRMDGAKLIVDGGILADYIQIDDVTIDSDGSGNLIIKDGGVSDIVSDIQAGTTGASSTAQYYNSRAEVTVNVPTGLTGESLICWSFEQTYPSGIGAEWGVRIRHGGTTILDRTGMEAQADYPSGQLERSGLSAGSHTFYLDWWGADVGSSEVSSSASLTVFSRWK